MSAGQILTDAQLSLLRTRLAMNPATIVDPAVVQQLLDTAEFYRNNIEQALWPRFPEQVAL